MPNFISKLINDTFAKPLTEGLTGEVMQPFSRHYSANQSTKRASYPIFLIPSGEKLTDSLRKECKKDDALVFLMNDNKKEYSMWQWKQGKDNSDEGKFVKLKGDAYKKLPESIESAWQRKDYDLALMLPAKKKADNNVLYLGFRNDVLQYKCIAPDGEYQENTITWQELQENGADHELKPKNGQLLEEFEKIKTAILMVTSKRGHTPDEKHVQTSLDPNDLALKIMIMKNEGSYTSFFNPKKGRARLALQMVWNASVYSAFSANQEANAAYVMKDLPKCDVSNDHDLLDNNSVLEYSEFNEKDKKSKDIKLNPTLGSTFFGAFRFPFIFLRLSFNTLTDFVVDGGLNLLNKCGVETDEANWARAIMKYPLNTAFGIVDMIIALPTYFTKTKDSMPHKASYDLSVISNSTSKEESQSDTVLDEFESTGSLNSKVVTFQPKSDIIEGPVLSRNDCTNSNH